MAGTEIIGKRPRMAEVIKREEPVYKLAEASFERSAPIQRVNSASSLAHRAASKLMASKDFISVTYTGCANRCSVSLCAISMTSMRSACRTKNSL